MQRDCDTPTGRPHIPLSDRISNYQFLLGACWREGFHPHNTIKPAWQAFDQKIVPDATCTVRPIMVMKLAQTLASNFPSLHGRALGARNSPPVKIPALRTSWWEVSCTDSGEPCVADRQTSDKGASLLVVFCGRASLQRLRYAARFRDPLLRIMNQCWFRRSTQNLPLKDSMNTLFVGLSGRLKSSVTLRVYAHRSNSREMNWLPSSTRIDAG